MYILAYLSGLLSAVVVIITVAFGFSSWLFHDIDQDLDLTADGPRFVGLSYKAESLLSMIWHAPDDWTISKAQGEGLSTYGEDAFEECCRLFPPVDRQGGE